MEDKVFEIRTTEGQLFCKCRFANGELRLLAKNCSIPIQELLQKAYGPIYHPSSK